MMLYNFYTDKTSAPIVNTMCRWLPETRMIEYKSSMEEKVFTLGYEGEIFDFIISKSDGISISIKNGVSPQPLRKFYKLFDHSVVDEISSTLLRLARNHTINIIVDGK